MSLIPQMQMIGGYGPTELDYIGKASSNTNGTSFTFSSQSLGTAFAGRRIIVVACGEKSVGLDYSPGITVGGTSMTIAHDREATSIRMHSMGILLYPTGTTADIVVTTTGTMLDMTIFVYAVKNLKSETASDTDSQDDTGAVSINLTVPEDGFAIASAVSVQNAEDSFAWTNDATEDDEQGTDAGAAGVANCTSSGSKTLTAQPDVYSGYITSVVGAAWR